MENAPKRRWISLIVITLFIALLFFVLNHFTHYVGDDYYYMYSFSTGERIENFSQIIDSQIAHYSSTNGRCITHTLAHLFLMLDEGAFDVLNVLGFILFLYVIYFHTGGTFQNFSLARFSVIAMLLFLAHPAFGESFLWTTGAANYLYGALIFLCALIPYRRQAITAAAARGLWREILLALAGLLAGFIAGWTNENTSVAMIVMMVCYIAYYKLCSIKLRVWHITELMGAVAGCVVMLTAPANANRLSNFESAGIVMWIKRLVWYTCDVFDYFHLVLILFVALLGIYAYQKRAWLKKWNRENALVLVRDSGVVLVYLIGFLASVYSMIVVPYFPERAWTGPLALLLIAVLSLWEMVDGSELRLWLGKALTVGFLLVFCGTTYMDAYVELHSNSAAYLARESKVEQTLAAGENTIELTGICGSGTYSIYGSYEDIAYDSTDWRNYGIARYYGLDEVIRVD